MNKTYIVAVLVAILTSIFMIHDSVPKALAQDFAAGINPPILFIEAEAPASVKAPITLENQSDQTITYGIYLRPFKANPYGNGIPNYDPELHTEYESFFENVQVRVDGEDITEISLNPKQSQDLELSILIPDDAPPIDRYFTVVFLASEGELNENNSSSGAKGGIGTNVLLTIGPKTDPEGRISKLNIPKFVTRGPVPIELEIANHNDYWVVSEGNLVIKNVFGHAVGSLEFGPLSILRQSNRIISDENSDENMLYWSEKYPIGIYTVTANVALSEKGPLLTRETTFIAFPIEYALIITLIIVVVVWLVRLARQKAERAS